jgi:hypothetical protein
MGAEAFGGTRPYRGEGPSLGVAVGNRASETFFVARRGWGRSADQGNLRERAEVVGRNLQDEKLNILGDGKAKHVAISFGSKGFASYWARA